MNGGHDLGGAHGLGPINPEPEDQEPWFHHDWERRVFGMTVASGMLGKWNIDQSRHARERQHPVDYIRNTYYENWLAGLEKLLVESGLVSAEEMSAKNAEIKVTDDVRIPTANEVPEILMRGGPVDMPAEAPPGFSIGDPVRVKLAYTAGHTRAPGYARGHKGLIHAHRGCHVFADANASGDKVGRHLYSVEFAACELWDDPSKIDDKVYIDLWEPHLDHP